MSELNVGNPVSGKDFIGREEEIKYITELLLLGQSVVLIAPRRYGKTSLVLEVLEKLKSQERYSAFIDIFSITTLEMLPVQITTHTPPQCDIRRDKFDH